MSKKKCSSTDGPLQSNFLLCYFRLFQKPLLCQTKWVGWVDYVFLVEFCQCSEKSILILKLKCSEASPPTNAPCESNIIHNKVMFAYSEPVKIQDSIYILNACHTLCICKCKKLSILISFQQHKKKFKQN